MPGERRVWLEQLRRRFDPSDPEQRRLCHQLLEALSNDHDDDAEHIATELSQRTGISTPGPD